MEILGYIAALFIGISLGLIGGGGSILTIPVLVYLFSFTPTIAIAYSLFIVGFTSMVGALNNYLRGNVDFKTALLFGAASVTTVFLSRMFVIPLIPEVFFTIGSFQVTHSLFVMVVFALLMIGASISMIKGKQLTESNSSERKVLPLILYGILVGLVTGFLGAGGGFLIIPSLVLLMKLPMKKAIGTSLTIIALNSTIGFLGDLGNHYFHWNLLLTITAIATIGIFIGGTLNRTIDGQRLRRMFGWFVLIMGLFIMLKEIF